MYFFEHLHNFVDKLDEKELPIHPDLKTNPIAVEVDDSKEKVDEVSTTHLNCKVRF